MVLRPSPSQHSCMRLRQALRSPDESEPRPGLRASPRPRAYYYVRRIVWKYRKRGTNYPDIANLSRGARGVKSMKPLLPQPGGFEGFLAATDPRSER